MSKKQKNTVVPALRFPEFENTGEWEEKLLGDVLQSESSSLAQSNLDFREVGFPVYGADGLIGYIESYTQDEDYIAILKDGSGVGKLFLYKGKSSISGTLAYLKPTNIKRYNLTWAFYLLHRFDLLKHVKGSGIPHIYYSDYSKDYVAVPHPTEQKKIADCLSSLDELIDAENQKLDALKDHKKGLLQQLFPAEGKIMPKLRFPGFDGEWKEKNLIGVTDKKIRWSFTGGPFGSNLKSSDYTAVGIRIIQLQNIGDGEFINEYKIYTSEDKANELLSCNIYPGDILMSKMGDPVGRACLVPNNHKRYVMCSDGIRIVVDEETFDKYFIYSLINSQLFRSIVEKTATGSTRKRIGLEELKNLPMFVPASKKEQQNIGSLLFALDEIINAQTDRIEQLKEHKKGLMQQLFPSPNN